MPKGVLVLGASGLIGSYLFNELSKNNNVIGTYTNNKKEGLAHFDVVNSDINNLPLNSVKYGVICSAVTKIDKCKDNPEHSNEVNVNGLERIVKEFWRKNITPVFLSSAAVFDGVIGGYKETDERNPTTLYGKQKVIMEDIITSLFNNYIIIRPGKVFGVEKGEGVLFSKWLEQYYKGEEIRCADDEKLSPTYVVDVAKGIKKLIENNANGTYHINPEEHFSRYEMAINFFSFLNIENAKITRCSIDDFNFAEKRPRNTFLDATKFMRETSLIFTPLRECFSKIKTEHK